MKHTIILTHDGRRQRPGVASRNFLLVAVIAIGFCLEGCGWSHPSDRELIANFESNVEDLEQLRRMIIAEPRYLRIALDHTIPTIPASSESDVARLIGYRDLLRKVGATSVNRDLSRTEVTFVYHSRGMAVSGSSKGICYCTTPPDHVVDSLDGYPNRSQRGPWIYRRLTEAWYLCVVAG